MIDNFIAGSLALFGDPFSIGIFVFGVIGGMLFGAIPGVSMLTLAAILLPFTANFDPAQGVMLFAVIYCTGTYGGAITAILFNIPGAPENAPTAFDGYPMTRNGQSGKAVGAAVLCSAIGGVTSAIIMMMAITVIILTFIWLAQRGTVKRREMEIGLTPAPEETRYTHELKLEAPMS